MWEYLNNKQIDKKPMSFQFNLMCETHLFFSFPIDFNQQTISIENQQVKTILLRFQTKFCRKN